MIPLKDINPTKSFPAVNILLILANVAVFVYQLTLPPRVYRAFVFSHGTIPAHIPSLLAGHVPASVALQPLFTSMFIHGSLMHLLGNMLFLYIFGDNVEDAFGHVGYLLFYISCGIGSGLLHVLINLHSTIPAVGASGAISGVMGAYMVMFPRNRILTFFFVFLLPIPAVVILVYWFALQFLEAAAGAGTAAAGGGVAVWAHIGGFIMGAVIAALAKRG